MIKLRTLLLLLALLLPARTQAATAYVQSAELNWFTTVSGETLNFGSNVTANNVIICGIQWTSNTVTLSTFTSSANIGAFTMLGNPTTSSTLRAAMGYAVVSSTGAGSVTFAVSGAVGYNLACHEVSGVDTTTPVGTNEWIIAGVTSTGTTTDAITSGNLTSPTTRAGAYIYGFFGNPGSSLTANAGTGFTSRLLLTNYGAQSRSEDQIQSGAGSIAATFTRTDAGGSQLVMVMAAALQPPGGGGGATVPKLMLLGVGGRAAAAVPPFAGMGFLAFGLLKRKRNLSLPQGE